MEHAPSWGASDGRSGSGAHSAYLTSVSGTSDEAAEMAGMGRRTAHAELKQARAEAESLVATRFVQCREFFLVFFSNYRESTYIQSLSTLT